MRIKQGDAYNIDIVLTTDAGDTITNENASVVEVALGGIVKTFPGDLIARPNAAVNWPGREIDWSDVRVDTEESDGIMTIEKYASRIPSFSVFSVGDVVNVEAKVYSAETPIYPSGASWEAENVKVVAVSDGQISIEKSDEDLNPGELYDLTIEKPAGTFTFVFPLSQEETFKMDGVRHIEARVKFLDDTVVGASVGVLLVEPSQSKEVL